MSRADLGPVLALGGPAASNDVCVSCRDKYHLAP
jgi:hypothetical protein